LENKSIMIVGVGGQGTLLTSRLLGNALISKGYDVKVSEVHGMSQRGGSVVTYVKYGDKVYSPIVEKGEADLIIAFEPLEAARWLEYLKPDGEMIVNTQTVDPMTVVTGAAEYPQDVVARLTATGAFITPIDALPIAEKIGSVKILNVVLVGAMAGCMDLPVEVWEESIRQTVPEKYIEMNLEAFNAGYGIKTCKIEV